MIDIMYSLNDKYFRLLYLSVMSLVKNTKEDIRIHIFSMDCKNNKRSFSCIKETQRKYLEEQIKKFNVNNEVVLHDVTNLYLNLFTSKFANSNTSFSPYSMIRLLVCDIKEITVDKIIYLDCDTMLCKDIKEFYDVDISNYEFAATRDIVGHHFFGNRYCNSGTLYFNLKKARETKLFEKCIKFVKTKHSFMPDQDALNKKAKYKLVLKDYRFNEQRDIKEETVIKHFCNIPHFFPIIKITKIKQDQIDDVHNVLKIHNFDDIYEMYLKEKENHKDIFMVD